MRGGNVKKSTVDMDAHDMPMLKRAAKSENILVPIDWKIERSAIVDIGPKTARLFRDVIKNAHTVVWSGPMGFIEKAKFRKGNMAIAKAIASNRQAFSVVGGGETVMFLKKYKLDKKISFVSTGGGAMLDFLAGEQLPGIEALRVK
jgi:phosphoglycerate kinase